MYNLLYKNSQGHAKEISVYECNFSPPFTVNPCRLHPPEFNSSYEETDSSYSTRLKDSFRVVCLTCEMNVVNGLQLPNYLSNSNLRMIVILSDLF